MIIDYPWYYLLFCLLAGLLYAGALYLWGKKSFSKRLQWWLAGLRFLAVSAIAFLLLAPLAKQTLNERQKPLVVIAQDVSQSMGADTAVAIPVESTENTMWWRNLSVAPPPTLQVSSPVSLHATRDATSVP